MPATKARPVAKKKQSGSEKRQFNALVRMDEEVLDRAKILAAVEKVSLGELVSNIVHQHVERELKKLGFKPPADQS